MNMWAKQKVKGIYPKAWAEKNIVGKMIGIERCYWMIRNGREVDYLGWGHTEREAWDDAKKKLCCQIFTDLKH